jgi:hypothetical protein
MSSIYCTKADIENQYGANNVSGTGGWADIANDGVSATITARINWAIARAGDEIDSLISRQWPRVPVVDQDGDTPTFLRDIAAVLAGIYLYESRGAEDVDNEGRPAHRLMYQREWAYKTLEEIRRGDRIIPGAV